MLDDKTLAFADFKGNRQYITVGNLADNDRVFMFLMELREPATDQGLGSRARGRGR